MLCTYTWKVIHGLETIELSPHSVQKYTSMCIIQLFLYTDPVSAYTDASSSIGVFHCNRMWPTVELQNLGRARGLKRQRRKYWIRGVTHSETYRLFRHYFSLMCFFFFFSQSFLSLPLTCNHNTYSYCYDHDASLSNFCVTIEQIRLPYKEWRTVMLFQ